MRVSRREAGDQGRRRNALPMRLLYSRVNPGRDPPVQVCPGSAKVHLNTAILRRRRGDWGGALEHLDAAQAIDPTYCEADFWRGLTFLKSNRCCDLLAFISRLS